MNAAHASQRIPSVIAVRLGKRFLRVKIIQPSDSPERVYLLVTADALPWIDLPAMSRRATSRRQVVSLTHLLSYIHLNSPGLTELLAVLAGGVLLFAVVLALIDRVMGRQSH